MIYVKVNDILKKKGKTKYWLIKSMAGGYQSISSLINNETKGIRFETLDRLCEVLECSPEDILERRKK